MTDGTEGLEQGRAAFNRGEYFLAHELWEQVWREVGEADRIWVQGLIQIAAGLHHLQRERPRPAAGLLRKGLEKLSRGGEKSLAHLRIDRLMGQVTRLLVELDAPGTAVVDSTQLKL
jgi:predicted metal-dependent hydrolase